MRTYPLGGCVVISNIVGRLFVLPWYLHSTTRGRLKTSWCTAFASRAQQKKLEPFGRLSLLDSSERINGEGSRSKKDFTPEKSNAQQERSAQTGWNHNLPSGNSDFWKGPRDEKKYSTSSTNSDTSSSSTKELRTGWLHNSGSKKGTTTQMTTKSADSSRKESSSNTNLARRRLEIAKLQQQRNHRILSPPTFHACGGDRVVVTTEHLVSVPVDYKRDQVANYEDGSSKSNQKETEDRIDIYFCIVETISNEATRIFYQNELNANLSPNQRASKYVEYAALKSADEMLLYLQGGPGFGAPPPVASLGLGKGCGSWADSALHELGYRRIVLMDQRGTGKSSPITKQTLERKFPNLFQLDHLAVSENGSITIDNFTATNPDETSEVQSAVEQVTEYLSQFRADNIVRDAEFIRDSLMELSLEDESSDATAPKPWGCSLGQSYGGFCQMTYLSQVNHPPKIMLFTGGIAPMLSDTVEVYHKLWQRVKERNLRYYEMYPGDVNMVKVIVQTLLNNYIKLPSGGRLTARRFLSLGISLGSSPSSFTSLHDLISKSFVGGPMVALQEPGRTDNLEFTRSFLKQIEIQQSFDDHPIYYWLHESIYADGPERSPTNWAAHRAYEDLLQVDRSEFDYKYTSSVQSSDVPTLFFGEHVFPWMLEDFVELGGFGLQIVANRLASKSDWGPLYDAQHMKMVLHDGRTRAAAAVYHEDMYVEFDASMKVAARDGPLGKCKLYVTNEYQHSGLRDNGSKLFAKLHGMAKGGTRTPS